MISQRWPCLGLPFALSHSVLLLTAKQIDRVHDVTDSLGLKRLAIIVPLPAAETGGETVMPDGNLLICAPYGTRFDSWFVGLRERLLRMDLSRTPRSEQLEPPMLRVPQQPQASGMRRYWDGASEQAHGSVGSADRSPKEEVLPPPSEDDGVTPAAVADEAETSAVPDLALANDCGGEG
ncbi:MAG: hypothetical protein HYY16_05985 [Planctomycetes bacterium]|nr:hypothetical protein [Planctomycetota bacterium]